MQIKGLISVSKPVAGAIAASRIYVGLAGLFMLMVALAGCSGKKDVAQNMPAQENAASDAVDSQPAKSPTQARLAADKRNVAGAKDPDRSPVNRTETPVTKRDPIEPPVDDREQPATVPAETPEDETVVPDEEEPGAPDDNNVARAKTPNVGDEIREITGTDVDGIEFSLSEYHGKVMMVDFWGDW